MNLAAGLIFGIILGLVAALLALASGYGIIASLGFYILFGVAGVFTVAGAVWVGKVFPGSMTKSKDSGQRNQQVDEPAE